MKNIVSKFYIVVAFLCSTAIMFAAPGDEAEGESLNGNDNQLSISDYLWVLALVGLVLVYFKFRRMQKNSIQG